MWCILRKHQLRIRALGAALLLFAMWVAPAVKLTFPEPVTCGMACCEASGVCYCSTMHKASGSHEDADHGQTEKAEQSDAGEPRISRVTFTALCSTECAQVPNGFQKIPLAKSRVPESSISVDIAELIFTTAPHFAHDELLGNTSAPRAPPAILT